MNRDPYDVLGIPRSASNEEIKTAYRTLAKRYHPDVNNGAAAAESKMKEINEAYAILMKGAPQTGSEGGARQGQRTYRSPYGSYGGGSSQQQSGDPFEEFFRSFGMGGFGGSFRNGQRQGYSGGTAGFENRTETNPELFKVRGAVQEGDYQKARYLLDGMYNRPAAWYYWSALVHLGTGQRMASLADARTCVSMEPDNAEFQSLLRSLQASGQQYQRRTMDFDGIRSLICGNPCLTVCVANMLCNCLCNNGCGNCTAGPTMRY